MKILLLQTLPERSFFFFFFKVFLVLEFLSSQSLSGRDVTVSSNRIQGAGTFSKVWAYFTMNYWVILVSERPFQRHWSRCRPCMWGCSFSAVYRVLQRAVQSRKQQQKRCAATFLGSECWQVAQQELHPSPETELFADGTVPSQGTAITFINCSI